MAKFVASLLSLPFRHRICLAHQCEWPLSGNSKSLCLALRPSVLQQSLCGLRAGGYRPPDPAGQFAAHCVIQFLLCR